MTDIATAFVETLAARGVTLTAHGKKGLAMLPKSAYGEMSADERKTLKQHKAAIIAVVRGGKLATKAAAPVEPPALCAYCYRQPCISETHEAYFALHPVARQRRDDERLTQEMHACLGRPRRRWDGLL